MAPISPAVALSAYKPGNLMVSSENGERVSTNAGGSFTSATTYFPMSAAAGGTSSVFDAQGRLFWANMDNLTPHNPCIAVTQVDPTTGSPIGSAHIVNIPPSGYQDDKPFLTADTNNNLFIVWTRFDTTNTSSILISRSTDQGVTWSAPVTVSATGEGFVWPATASVAPNSDVFVAYHAGPVYADGTTGETFVARYANDLSFQRSKNLAFVAGASDVTANVQSSPRKIPLTQFWT